jgi:hypothetical protein
MPGPKSYFHFYWLSFVCTHFKQLCSLISPMRVKKISPTLSNRHSRHIAMLLRKAGLSDLVTKETREVNYVHVFIFCIIRRV